MQATLVPVEEYLRTNYDPDREYVDGQIVENFCELDRVDDSNDVFEPRRMHDDHPQKPKVWSDFSRAGNMWGPPPPADFLD